MATRGSYSKGMAKRDEVLRTALGVFAEKGYLKTSIRELADAANLSQAGLLHYFGSKEELLVEILRRREELNTTAEAGADKLTHFLEVIHENVLVPGLAQLFATMSTAATDDAHPAHDYFLTRYAELRAAFAQSIRNRQDNGEIDPLLDADRLAAILIAVADGLQIQWLIDETLDMPGSLDYLWTLVHLARAPR